MTKKIRKFTVFHKEIYGIPAISIRKFTVFHKEIYGKSNVKNKEIYGSSKSPRPAKGEKIRKLTVFGRSPAPSTG